MLLLSLLLLLFLLLLLRLLRVLQQLLQLLSQVGVARGGSARLVRKSRQLVLKWHFSLPRRRLLILAAPGRCWVDSLLENGGVETNCAVGCRWGVANSPNI